MAKVSMKNRELKREETVVKYAAKRAELKAIIKNPNSSDDERWDAQVALCLLYTSPSPRDRQKSRMPSSA